MNVLLGWIAPVMKLAANAATAWKCCQIQRPKLVIWVSTMVPLASVTFFKVPIAVSTLNYYCVPKR